MPTDDGMCVCWSLQNFGSSMVRLTGTDIDHVTAIRKCAGSVYCSCRDGNVRVYSIADFTRPRSHIADMLDAWL